MTATEKDEPKPVCQEDGCDRLAVSSGLCASHEYDTRATVYHGLRLIDNYLRLEAEFVEFCRVHNLPHPHE